MPDTIADALGLLRLAEYGTLFQSREREKLIHLNQTASEQPEQVWEELEDLRRQVVERLPTSPPQHDYARCISIAQYWRYCLPESTQEEFENAADYAAFLEMSSDPGGTAYHDLNGPENDVLFPAAFSWIVPRAQVEELDRTQLAATLQMREHPPRPLLLLILPLDNLIEFGCTIRRPVGLDAVHNRHLQWIENGVPGERIDGPLLRGTVGGILWKP